MNHTQIAPGAYITALPGEKFKRCKVAIRMVLPGRRETASALALLPNLLNRRCAAIADPIALSRHLYNLYGAEIASESFTVGANRVVTIGVSGLKNAYALEGENLEAEYTRLACRLLFEPVAQNGAFDAGDVAIEKEKQAEYLKSEINEKRLYCLQQARRKLYGASPLGLESSGYLEDIDGLTPQGLYSAYQTLLQQAQFEITVFGMPAEAAAKQITEYLAKVQRTPVEPLPASPAEGKPKPEQYAEAMDTIQGKLCIMLTSGKIPNAYEAAVMRVAGAILGGLPSSRLFMNVREKQSLCYYCASSYSAFGGTLTIDSGVEHKNLRLAADAIMKELHTLQTELATDEEIAVAKLALQGAFTTAQDSPGALESWAFTEIMRGTGLTMQQFAQMVQQVTRQEVQAALAAFTPAVEYAIVQKEAGK